MFASQLLSEEGYRPDGRMKEEVRTMKGKMGVFKQADGSASFEIGQTRVLAVVYGPHELRGGRGGQGGQDEATINCQYSMAAFSTSERKVRPRNDQKSTELTLNIKNTFEAAILTKLYPHSKIDIFVEVLQSDGGNLAACINAATLALVDAGVSLKGLVVGCSVGWWEGHVLSDLNYMEENQVPAKVTVAGIPGTEHLYMLNNDGKLFLPQLEASLNTAQRCSLLIHQALVATIRRQQVALTE